MKLIISTKATASLKRIAGFIAQVSEPASKRTIKRILDKTNGLLKQPLMGYVEKRYGSRTVHRALIVRPYYKVIYNIKGDTIRVVDIWDCRQEPKK